MQDHYSEPPENYWNEKYFEISPNYFTHQITTVKNLIKFKKGMKSLDIGAGLGKAMISMEKQGFDTFGFEPSVPFYERAISMMNVNKDKLKLGAIENVEYIDETFDFITFGAVFEHLYDPSKSLKKAFRWLKPKGIIHIEVPSSKWLMPKFMNFYFKLRGTNYVTNLSPMHSPFHLYEFDEKSFTELAKEINFEIEQTRFDVCSIYYIPKFLHPILRKYMEWTNTGMQMTLYLRKK